MSFYPAFNERTVKSINGIWDFTFLGPDADIDKISINKIVYDDVMAVPAAFDATPKYAGKRGLASYKTKIHINSSKKTRILFGSAGFFVRIFINGSFLYEHAHSYSPFWCDIPADITGNCELTVLVDNRFNFNRSPLHESYFDFYQYGGILRNVEIHEVPDVYIESVSVYTTDFKKGKICANIKLSSITVESINVSISIDGEPEEVFNSRGIKDNLVKIDLYVKNKTLWSAKEPNLHTMRIVINDDDMIIRFGIREIKIKGNKILINGKEIKLLGYCRHEAHPQFGPSLPESLMLSDLQILKNLGCNFIRGVHYPMDQRFLDLCDELGFYVWEESLGWGQGEKQLNNKLFKKEHDIMLHEMINTSINHPSVIMWGFLNEAQTDIENFKTFYEDTISIIRKLDPSRPVTYASNKMFNDKFLDLIDIVSFNLYPGWYSSPQENPPPRPLNDIVPVYKKHTDMVKKLNKPFIISEGGAGALYGWHDTHKGFWSEDYQADCLEIICNEIINNKDIQGIAIWQLFDCRSKEGTFALWRPRSFNNKGTLDEYRRPKLAYDIVKKIFNGNDK